MGTAVELARRPGREAAVTHSGESRSGPTVQRLLLGAQLRRLRQAAGISRDEAGHTIRASTSKMTRMELGQVSCKIRDVADLLTLYGVTDELHRNHVLQLVRQAHQPGWWHTYNDLVPDWFVSLIDLEPTAFRIRTYESQFIPGLLQTRGYARAVIAHGNPTAASTDIERRVALRMTRGELLLSPDPPRLWAVIDETALQRTHGGSSAMRTQLEYLLEAAKLPTVTIQVLPFARGLHSGESGAFSLLRFPQPDLPDLVYLEQLTGASYLSERRYVDAYTQAMEQLCVEAEDPHASAERIADLLART